MGEKWWRGAVVYQAYLRSFADGNGDGIGDFAGLHARLPYLRELGVDAVWLNPCYRSPQRDHGYDVSDYLDVDPAYGTLDDFRSFLGEAHASGIRVLMDIVPNHCSSEHEWFQAALAAGPGSEERRRFLFRPGRGRNGELPPNNWRSVFGGLAWTRVVEADGQPGEWYFHAFDSGQPDFDWRHPDVSDYFQRVLRHWYDLGVDGFRIDVAHGLFKDPDLPDYTGPEDGHNAAMWNQPEVHDTYRSWRRLADLAVPPRYYVGEIWVPDTGDLARYVSSEELHQAFSFDLLVQPWHADSMRRAIDRGISQGRAAGEPPAWALSNHDVHRTVTRYGQQQDLTPPTPSDMIAAARRRGRVDLAIGTRRARAVALLQLALPGTVFLYQGEELGLPEVFDLADEDRQDPIWLRSAGAELGRDGCRVPLPWASAGPNLGFSAEPNAARSWLPQPEWFADFAVERQEIEPDSMLSLYRRLLAARRDLFAPDTELEWEEPPTEDSLVFRRGAAVCVVNFGDAAVPLPSHYRGTDVVARSAHSGAPDVVPANSAVWLLAVGAASPSGAPTTGVEDSPIPQLVPTAS